jgi:hypothetical protein
VAGLLVLRPFRPAPVAPPPPPTRQEAQVYYLLVDPKDATVDLDQVPVDSRELPVEAGPPRAHRLKVSAPGRMTRSLSFTPTPGMKLGVRLGRTLPALLPTEPPPLPAELSVAYPDEPPPSDQIDDAFAKLDRYAGCLAGLGFAEGDSRRPSTPGRPGPVEVAHCQQVVDEAVTKWPHLPEVEAAAAAFMAAANEGQSPEVLARAAARLRAEFLVARRVWQMNELARIGKEEGRGAGWHMRRVALAGLAWARARRAGPQEGASQRAGFEESLEALAAYGHKDKEAIAHTVGATDFLRQAQAMLALGRAGRPTSESAVSDACRKLLADFDALVLE